MTDVSRRTLFNMAAGAAVASALPEISLRALTGKWFLNNPPPLLPIIDGGPVGMGYAITREELSDLALETLTGNKTKKLLASTSLTGEVSCANILSGRAPLKNKDCDLDELEMDWL